MDIHLQSFLSLGVAPLSDRWLSVGLQKRSKCLVRSICVDGRLRFVGCLDDHRRLFNLCYVETIAWLFNIILCLLLIFVSPRLLIPILIFNSLSRSTLISSCQSLLSTLFDEKRMSTFVSIVRLFLLDFSFPSAFIGRLTGLMWTIVGAITFIQFALLKLTHPIDLAWRVRLSLSLRWQRSSSSSSSPSFQSWLIVLALNIVMIVHLVELWGKFIRNRHIASKSSRTNDTGTEMHRF